MTINLPSSLASAIAAAETLEAKTLRTREALAAATTRAEFAGSEQLQAELERDRVYAERDAAAAAEALGEVPEMDTAELKKLIQAVDKRVTAARSEVDGTKAAKRGLEGRLVRETAECAGALATIKAAQNEARGVLREAAVAACADLAREIALRVGPIVAAESQIDGWEVGQATKGLSLPFRAEGQPYLHDQIKAASAPPEFARAKEVTLRLARVVEREA